MTMKNDKMRDFVIIPRKIRDDLISGKLSRNQFDILIWIFINTNPVNGYFTANYKGLVDDFCGKISYTNIRKIISYLRHHNYIYFEDHRGRGGSFPIYPMDYLLSSSKIQTIEYLKNKDIITNSAQSTNNVGDKQEPNLDDVNHKAEHNLNEFYDKFSMDKKDNKSTQITTPITTPNNDNDTNKDNLNIVESSSNKKYSQPININDFKPSSSEENRCLEIAKILGEKDMRFILSILRKSGKHVIDIAFGITKEKMSSEEGCNNPAAYFNKTVNNLIEK